MESLQQPTMQTQDQIEEIHQIPTSSNQPKSGFQASESKDQQQLLKRPNESKNEEKIQTLNTQECKSGDDHDDGKMEKKGDDQSDEKPRENQGNMMGPRERLKRHRTEVAGQVWIPDMWGQEDFLKDWIDCSAFDSALMPKGIMLARASLMQEGRRSNSNTLRLENTSC